MALIDALAPLLILNIQVQGVIRLKVPPGSTTAASLVFGTDPQAPPGSFYHLYSGDINHNNSIGFAGAANDRVPVPLIGPRSHAYCRPGRSAGPDGR